MKVYKFGGASVKDANGLKYLVKVLNNTGYENTLVVVSAMGKTTNAFEEVVRHYVDKKQNPKKKLEDIKSYHFDIINDLFGDASKPVLDAIHLIFKDLETFLSRNKSPNFNYIYDQTVSCGEIVSTKIISFYLEHTGINNHWLDARQLIKTDNYYRSANVNWDITQEQITQKVDENNLNITQGFIASDANNFTTTLGREGSDYTAAILAYCINADSVTIWKDVPGVLNADPRYFNNTQLLHQISYTEAIELAFYGASVIHPKTLQPLQGKEIPLYVKSFLNPLDKGTRVSKGKALEPEVPCYIVKKGLVLISLSSLDFSYIVEENISEIFKLLHHYKMKVDMIQNSAISFSVCVNNMYEQLEPMLLHLKAKFKVTSQTGVSLYTIRHYNEKAIKEITKHKTVLLKQSTQETFQMVCE